MNEREAYEYDDAEISSSAKLDPQAMVQAINLS